MLISISFSIKRMKAGRTEVVASLFVFVLMDATISRLKYTIKMESRVVVHFIQRSPTESATNSKFHNLRISLYITLKIGYSVVYLLLFTYINLDIGAYREPSQ